MEWGTQRTHPRTIIHVDIDCFYVQVELLKRPHLKNEAVGIKQKNIVVTCNYEARNFGVKKCMLVSEALRLCPQLLLLNGEDLYEYRQASNRIHELLLSFAKRVERSGFDENYLDVTELVEISNCGEVFKNKMEGHHIGDYNDACPCGCHERLSIGALIASNIRSKLANELGFTSCCGISYNKLLAKLSCSANKPNKQTVLFPNGVSNFLKNLVHVDKIPGVGETAKTKLESINVTTVETLQKVSLSELKKVFKNEQCALNMKKLSLGICDSEVKPSGKPISIGLEDGCRIISVEREVKEKFSLLLQRLLILVNEDGRIPMTVKVTVRKYNKETNESMKESRQCPISGSLFNSLPGKPNDKSFEKLLEIIMSLFRKIVNTSRPFHLTLLGLSFSKFQKPLIGKSLASFFLKKNDLGLESLADFACEGSEMVTPCGQVLTSNKTECDSEPESLAKKAKLENVAGTDDKLCFEDSLKTIDNYPGQIDPAVFKELPEEIRKSIILEWGSSSNGKKPASKGNAKQSMINMFYGPRNPK